MRDLHAVVFGERQTHEAISDVAFVARMNVAAFADVDDDGLAAVLDGVLRLRLAFAQFSPGAVAGLGLLRHEIGELHPVEGEIALLPLVAPVLDHEREEVAVFIGAGGIAFALIPDGAFDAVADRGEQNAVVDVAGAVVAGKLLQRALRGAFAELGLFRLRFVSALFPGGEAGFVALLGGIAGEILLTRRPAVHEGFEASILLQHIAAHPGLRGAAAPRVVDQTHRHIERLMQRAAEEKAHTAEFAHIGWRALRPRAFEVILRLLRADLRHGDEADVWELRRGDLQIGVIALRDAPLHVRLAGADPHLADEDVFELHLVGALDAHRRGFRAGRHGIEFHGPLALRIGLAGLGLAAESDSDLRAGRVPAPDRVRLLLLKHHVVADDGGEFDFRVRGSREREEGEDR